MSTAKLSDAQHRALRVLAEKGWARYSNETRPGGTTRAACVYWMPADKLIALGLAAWDGGTERHVVITEAGREALAARP